MRNLDTSSGAGMHDWGHFEWTPTGRDLLTNAKKAGMGGTQKVEGDASVHVSFDNLPGYAKAYMKHGGMFKNSSVDWGTPMPTSNPSGAM
jgi:hypothetical protein